MQRQLEIDDYNVTLPEGQIEKINEYIEKSCLIFSKTLALFDKETYIAPYMILSDEEWLWPSYFSYFTNKEKIISNVF